jgi:two-component system sensor kinase FixL
MMINERTSQLELENATLRALLQKEVAKNELKAGFLAEVSHALRSPLTSIQLSTSLIERYYERLEKQKIQLHLEKIRCAVQHSVALMDNYLLTEAVEKQDDIVSAAELVK